MTWPPTVQNFKDQFFREFKYADGLDSVMDKDISRAINESVPMFNRSIFPTSDGATFAFLYLAAHVMVMNIQGAGGLSAINRGRGARNVGEGVQVAKGVGQANVTYQVPPPRVANNPTFLYYFRTDFGQRYMQLALPLTAGAMAVVCGPGPNQFNDE